MENNSKPLFGEPEAKRLRELFLEELKDVYGAEQQLVAALPKMQENASDEELSTAIEEHLVETKNQVARIEQIFAALGEEPESKTCKAMEGLIEEAEEMMEETEEGVIRDTAIIACAQKVEHYEIASYGTLIAWAGALGEMNVVALLKETLEEEKDTDQSLTQLAMTAINLEAAEQDRAEESQEAEEED